MAETSTSRGSKFIKDIGIYAIGNLGSKLVTFLLVPLYTFYIAPKDYGYYDLCFSVILVLIPFICLQLQDGSFRFLIESKTLEHKQAIISFVYRSIIRNILFTVGITIFLSIFYDIHLLLYISALLIVMSIFEVLIQVVRGLGMTKFYVLSGIISAIFICLFSIIFVVWAKMGIPGIFLANILGRISAILFIEIKLHIFKKYFVFNLKDKKITKDLLKYCLPLLPGNICWWIVSSSNKFFIEHYLGLQENGLYAVGIKFASILQIIAYIFYQAWQENALIQYNSADRDKFFSKVFNNYFYILSLLVIVFSFCLKLNYNWLVDINYYDSINYIYPLAISSMFYSLAAFFDMGYQCTKKTARTLPGIVLAAIINIVSNYILIRFNVYGIIISSIFTFASLFIYRVIDSRSFFKISFSVKSIIMAITVAINAYLFYYIQSEILTIIYLCCLMLVFIYFAPNDITKIVRNKILHKS